MTSRKPRINTNRFAQDYPLVVCVYWDVWGGVWSVDRGRDLIGSYQTWEQAIKRALGVDTPADPQ